MHTISVINTYINVGVVIINNIDSANGAIGANR
jgi:hypothetical protein